MVIAALVIFGILLVAWIVAPNGQTPTPAPTPAPTPSHEPVPATT